MSAMKALLVACALALDSTGTSNFNYRAKGTFENTVNHKMKPAHMRGTTTVHLVPTERRHLVSLVDVATVTEEKVVDQSEHKHNGAGTTTISLLPTHKNQPIKEQVQLLQKKQHTNPSLPSQGYSGGSVKHEDGQTMTADWHHEYDPPKKPAPSVATAAALFAIAFLA